MMARQRTAWLRALGYRRLGGGNAFWLLELQPARRQAFLLLLIAAGAAAAVTLGSVPVGWRDLAGWALGTAAPDGMATLVLERLRMPRVLVALLGGAMLGMAGAAMQSVTRNSLADPGLIGVKEGASIAILALVLVFPTVSPHWRPVAGLGGGAAVALSVLALARSASGLRFVLLGVGVSWLLASGISLFITMARLSEVQTAMLWLSGSLHAASWHDLRMAAPWMCLGTGLLLATARAGDAAALGDRTATGLGLRLGRLALLRLLATVIMTAASIAMLGGLGFVGLVAPHIARLAIGARQIPLLLGSALIGALLVLAADTLGRLLFAPVQVPAGVVMAILGVPFFLLVLWQRRHEI